MLLSVASASYPAGAGAEAGSESTLKIRKLTEASLMVERRAINVVNWVFRPIQLIWSVNIWLLFQNENQIHDFPHLVNT